MDGGGIVWSTGGDANWFAQNDVTHDGVDAAQSGSIPRSRSSSLSATLEGPGTLTFKWKVSSDVFGDYLAFYLDGSLQTGDLRRIAGNKDWTEKTVAIPAGSHTVEWRYSKDFYVDGGADAGWVDEVQFLTPYQNWASVNNLMGSEAEMLANPDSDRLLNLQEFAFGTDPSTSDASRLAFVIDGALTTAGSPMLMNLAQPGQSDDYRIVFPRRKDHAAIGLNYTVQFSADLVRWTTSSASPTVLTDPGSSHDYEVVSLAFPNLVPVANDGEPKPARFTRITVSID